MYEQSPTYVSLFSATGGLDLGLHRAGFRALAFCEWDGYRRDVLRRHWPDVPVFDDVSTLTAEQVRAGLQAAPVGESAQPGGELVSVADAGVPAGRQSDALRPDLLVGGFPCQDLSVAGLRAGLAGGRSGLFYEAARLIDELQPEWLLLENVPGLLTSNDGADFAAVIDTLGELGYGVAWRVLDAQNFGVPQRRRRVFIVGRRGGQVPAELLFECEGGSGDPGALRAARSAAAARAAGGAGEPGSLLTGRSAWTKSHASNGGDDPETWKTTEVSHTLNKMGQAPTVIEAQHFLTRAYTRGKGGNMSPIACALTKEADRGDGHPQVLTPTGIVRRLTPTECERLQGFPDGWTIPEGPSLADTPSWYQVPADQRDPEPVDPSPHGRRYAATGDAVAVPVAEWLGRRLRERL